MIILFAPSEGKKKGGTFSPITPESMIFPELYARRLEAAGHYEAVALRGNDKAREELFGIKDPKEFERYSTPFKESPTMKAIERYDGVAYDYLGYENLPVGAQEYIETNVVVFSNLFGPISAGDRIPDYKYKQGSVIGKFIPEKHYRAYFSNALDEWIGEREILDLRAGFYDKFYIPAKRPVTMKFLKEGKSVSHWAKAYRGSVLREAALYGLDSIEKILAHNIEGLKLEEIIETKKKKEIVYSIY